ncbi:MAG: DUF523 and DUF1722 domain-containing protein [Desulfobacteraceae bacterium]|nr:DUF523 and DUF1722 domain-containing protein [Desulfobacteraceae bacterium]
MNPDTESKAVEKIKLGISACLMGQNVRYNGGHTHDPFLTQTLGRYVDYVPVCPEVECGLPVPREAMRLVGDPSNPALVTIKTGINLTGQMKSWGQNRLDALQNENLCGFIFKSRSPSSGMERVKVYDANGIPDNTGVGIWARMFMDRFPLLPVEDEGRLHDPVLRENFIQRIFIFKRFQEMRSHGIRRGLLVDFHTRHKLLLMSHSPAHYREMGKLVAGIKNQAPETFHETYAALLNTAMSLRATAAKNINVLMHIMGYFKKQLSSDEKQELLEIIDQFKKHVVPLIVPITLINHYVRKYGEPYLKTQVYLNPHPAELGLRNHA